MGDWQNGTFGCFGNCTLCLISCFAPCVVFGKTAEAVDKSCLLCCLATFIPVLDLICFLNVRGEVRAKNGIDGSLISDLLCTCFCPFCTLVQTAAEVGVFS